MKKKTKDQKWKERLKKDLVKRLLYEDVVVSMSVAKELDEFVDVTVAKEISLAKKEMGKALKMVEMDNRPEITEWLFCKNRDEANGFNIAVKELNQVIDNYLERKK